MERVRIFSANCQHGRTNSYRFRVAFQPFTVKVRHKRCRRRSHAKGFGKADVAAALSTPAFVPSARKRHAKHTTVLFVLH